MGLRANGEIAQAWFTTAVGYGSVGSTVTSTRSMVWVRIADGSASHGNLLCMRGHNLTHRPIRNLRIRGGVPSEGQAEGTEGPGSGGGGGGGSESIGGPDALGSDGSSNGLGGPRGGAGSDGGHSPGSGPQETASGGGAVLVPETSESHGPSPELARKPLSPDTFGPLTLGFDRMEETPSPTPRTAPETAVQGTLEAGASQELGSVPPSPTLSDAGGAAVMGCSGAGEINSHFITPKRGYLPGYTPYSPHLLLNFTWTYLGLVLAGDPLLFGGTVYCARRVDTTQPDKLTVAGMEGGTLSHLVTARHSGTASSNAHFVWVKVCIFITQPHSRPRHRLIRDTMHSLITYIYRWEATS